MNFQINDRIEVKEGVLGGKPVIAGTRLDVETVVSHLLAGDSDADILEAFPFIKLEDVQACRDFVSKMAGLKYSIVELKRAQ